MTDEEMRQAQIEQAARIAADLQARFPALEISGQAYAEPTHHVAGDGNKPPRYVAVYVTLIPKTVRMVILLSGAGLNNHGYQLRGMSETLEDGARFQEFMERAHPSITIKNEGSERPYTRVPLWEQGKGAKNLRIENDDFEAIAWNVLVGLAFIAKLPTTRWNA
jgi:hypothetical protein